MHALPSVSCILFALLSAACSTDPRNESTAAVPPVTATKPPPVQYISASALKQYVLDCQPIRANQLANSPFKRLAYDKIIAYDYDGGDEESVIAIVQQGQLAPTVKRQQRLSQQQVDDVTTFLGAPETYGQAPTFCFIPHFGLVFFKGTAITASISVCLSCNRLSSSIAIPATQAQQIKIGKEDAYPAEGFSKPGREKLVSLIDKLGFSGK